MKQLKLEPTSTSILIRRERILKFSIFLALLVSSIVVVFVIKNMLVSFILAVVLSYLFSPMVVLLERARVPRPAAVGLLFGITGLILGLSVYLLFPAVSEQLANLHLELPSYVEGARRFFARIEVGVKSVYFLKTLNLSDAIEGYLLTKGNEFFEVLPALLGQTLTITLLAPFFAYFMLVDGRSMAKSVLTLVPNNIFELALHLNHQINDQIGGFIRARLLESAIVGGVVWLGLSIFPFPYAFLLAVFAALTNLIPYIGPVIGFVPALLICLGQEQASLYIFIASTVYGLAQVIDVAFVVPFVIARIVNLHPVTVVVVIIIGSQIMGILGMVISIPIASVLKVTISSIYNHLIQVRS